MVLIADYFDHWWQADGLTPLRKVGIAKAMGWNTSKQVRRIAWVSDARD
jgi:hypothetical protein